MSQFASKKGDWTGIYLSVQKRVLLETVPNAFQFKKIYFSLIFTRNVQIY